MKKSDFNTLLSKLPVGKYRWLYDNHSGFFLTVHVDGKAWGVEYDALYKILRISACCLKTHDTVISACYTLTRLQADHLHTFFCKDDAK